MFAEERDVMLALRIKGWNAEELERGGTWSDRGGDRMIR
jgi:hypothetical protein